MNIPASITATYPTASSCRVVELYHPEKGWGAITLSSLDESHLRNLHQVGYTTASLQILDADGNTFALHADFRLEELLVGQAQDQDSDDEIVRVRGINVRCFERGLDSSVDDWTCEGYETNTCRAGKSWIEGPRGLIAAMSSACFEMCDDNITETATDDWCVTTPDWMREQAVERMIKAAERACRKIDAQL